MTENDDKLKLKVSATLAASPNSLSPAEIKSGADHSLSWYARREPRVILALASVATFGFFGVSGLSGIYRQQLEKRGSEWFSRGNAAFRSGTLGSAINDFQVALSFSRDNFGYELRLAQALVALNRKEEALAYLNNLWQREPENGSVNLELARIYSQKKDVTQALRYYHNAIYAVWGGNDAEARQLSTRLELIQFLLQQKAQNQAEAELISLGKNLPDDPPLLLHIADLYMQVPDYQRALEEYRQVLKLERHNCSALAGAGRAAFELGEYQVAQRYLASAVALQPADTAAAQLLNLTKMIPKTDPYQLYSPAERRRAVIDAFNTAGQRLNTCLNQDNHDGSAGQSLQALYGRWMEMKTRLTEQTLRRHPEWLDPAMDLVFSIERQTNESCGTPSEADKLLLLISKLHEGNQ